MPVFKATLSENTLDNFVIKAATKVEAEKILMKIVSGVKCDGKTIIREFHEVNSGFSICTAEPSDWTNALKNKKNREKEI